VLAGLAQQVSEHPGGDIVVPVTMHARPDSDAALFRYEHVVAAIGVHPDTYRRSRWAPAMRPRLVIRGAVGTSKRLASSSSRRNGDWVPAPTIQWIAAMA
jgi:hypothetical protein